MKESNFYKIMRPIVKLFTIYILKAKTTGKENIPKEGRIIFAGTHTSIMDPLLLMTNTNREIHFLAKIELFRGWRGIIFKHLGLIPVDRQNGSPNAIPTANEILNDNRIIGIFPEGKVNKNRGTLLPLKRGAVTMAYDTNTLIVPFAIKGKYKMFSKNLKIIYGKPIKVKTNNVKKENEILSKEILKLMK